MTVKFASARETDNLRESLLQAAATNMGEFTVRQDFMEEIGDYLLRNAPTWMRIPKEPAEADLVKEIRQTALPVVGFTNKQDLSTTPDQTALPNRNNLSDPGQAVKAIAGSIEFSHYARSLHQQQGSPYQNQVSKDTSDLLDAITQKLEYALFLGSEANDPLEPNGIVEQMAAGNIFTGDLTATTPDTVSAKLIEAITRISASRTQNRRVTDIFTTGAGWNLLQREIEDKRLFIQEEEVLPGIQVPAILTQWGRVPISMTPYLNDTSGGVGVADTISYWLVNMDHLVWKGVVPFGGEETFDPQIFEITSYANGTPLTEKRMGLIYGTLYAKNRGESIWRLDITVPEGTAWSYT